MRTELFLKPKLEEVSTALEKVEATIRSFVKSSENLGEFIIALEEILVNIVKYSKASYIKLEFELREENRKWTVFSILIDDGEEVPKHILDTSPDLSLPLSKRKIGGLGLYFVKKLIDEFKYEHINGENFWFMKKYFS